MYIEKFTITTLLSNYSSVLSPPSSFPPSQSATVTVLTPMREDNPSWFVRWEEELPSPEELTPLSQSLITPHLALAFQIGSPNKTNAIYHQKLQSATPTPPIMNSDFGGGSTDLGSGSIVGGTGDEPTRSLKRPRLVWTPQLHKRFVDAVGHLGIKNAVPKTIMQMMRVDGLTRENVASHLQKYRLYLRRMQGGNGNGDGIAGGHVSVSDSATDRLFASSPVPVHFLNPIRLNPEYLMPPLEQHQVIHNLRYGNGDGDIKILKLFPAGN